jgi:hypothetical protein
MSSEKHLDGDTRELSELGMPDLKNLSDLESHIVMLGFACVRRKGSSHAFFLSFLSLCKDNSD